MKSFAALSLLLAWLLSGSCLAQPTTYRVGNTTLTLSTLTPNLDTPWELLWGPDNFLWMTERGGRISRVDPTTGQLLPLLTIADVTETGESGLLGMAVGQSFAPNALPGELWVYVVYNYTNAGSLREKLVRYRYLPAQGLSTPVTLLNDLPAQTTHSGSRLLLLPDNTLLMTTGDAQNTSLSQNAQSLNGKILRLNLDGTVPASNPTPGSLVYTLGHRNPQGLVRVAATGRIYSSEHGPNNDDELNLIEAGRNYGWPAVEGFCNLAAEQTFCQQNNVREPLVAWTPTRAVSGLAYYDHPAIPEWRNNLLLNSLKDGAFTYLPLSTTGEQVTRQADLWAGTYGRLRAVCVSPQGRVYVATSNRDGRGNPAAADDRIFVLENRAYTPTASTAARPASLGLYPNPATATEGVTLNVPTGGGTLLLTDALGRQVWRTAVAAQQTQLRLPATPPGLYLLRLRTSSGQELQGRLVRQ